MGRNENHKERMAHRRERYLREDINGRLVINLRDLGHALRGLLEGRGSQRGILIVLRETGTITQRELTGRLNIQPGSASEVIAKLENAGLVTRTASEADRRTADISLTGEGLRQAELAKAQRVRRHGEMFSALTEEEKAQLLALLEKVSADWETRYADQREGCGPHHGPHDGHHGGHGQPAFAGHPHNGGRDGHGGPHREAPDVQGRHGCSGDCANCPHPCGRAKGR